MTEIRFYHLQSQSFEQALPALLSKAYQSEKRILVQMSENDNLKAMNDHLWSFNPNSFLPHTMADHSHASEQPILLTNTVDNKNNAKILILAGGAENENLSDFDLCCLFLNGHDEAQVKSAREKWKAYKEQGHDITYWQQSDNGKWEQKA